ncbi:hypothetical protein FWK35_00008700, partial [Aphis craccivora]
MVYKELKKITEKRSFLSKTSFRPNHIFYTVVTQKQICKYLKLFPI